MKHALQNTYKNNRNVKVGDGPLTYHRSEKRNWRVLYPILNKS